MSTAIGETRLHREIHEQPAVIERLLREQRGATLDLARAIRTRDVTHVVVAARGTSDNAARYAKYALGARNGLLVGLAAPSLYSVYKSPPRFHRALVLGISQSGRSPDIVGVLAEARRQGALTAVITNDPRSDLAGEGDVVVDLGAGEEKSVAATKTYTAELAAIALLSATLGEDASAVSALERVPDAVAETLAAGAACSRVAGRLREMVRSVVIGRGYNYATAFEISLKLKELTYTVVEPYSSADFLHGPLALLEEGFPVLVVAPSGSLLEEMRALVATLRERRADVVCISDDAATRAAAQDSVEVPPLPEWLSPFTLVVPGQLLALHLAHERGYDVDSPRAIRKVTETR